MRSEFEQQVDAVGFERGETLLVAVSGGVDSVVLLHLLLAVSKRFGLSLQVAHLNHQIRSESPVDAEFVQNLCAKWGVPCHVESCDVPALAESQRLSMEMAGRQARHNFLRQQADRLGTRLIALAHHRDDQAETFMLRLLRGSGVSGLASMQTLDGTLWRPLLGFSREQVVAYAQQQGLEWREDASNSDPAYLRNRLRHQLLPQLRQFNPRLDERLAELCRQLQADDEYWQGQLADVFPSLLIADDDGLRLARQKLLDFPEALLVRVVREAIRQVRGSLQRLESVHLRAIVQLVKGERSQAQLDLPGCWVARRYDVLWVRTGPAVALPAYDLELPVPGELLLPCGRMMRAGLVSSPEPETATRTLFSLAGLELPLRVRNWRFGDRFAPQGMTGHKHLKRLFGDARVELEERQGVPLLVSGEEILWVAGLRRSGSFPVTEKSAKILRLELLERV